MAKPDGGRGRRRNVGCDLAQNEQSRDGDDASGSGDAFRVVFGQALPDLRGGRVHAHMGESGQVGEMGAVAMLPLAFGSGIGSELRRPLGIAMVGGLLFSHGSDLRRSSGISRRLVSFHERFTAGCTIRDRDGPGSSNSRWLHGEQWRAEQWRIHLLSLKPRAERDASASEIVNRLSPKLGRLTGASTFLQAAQDLGVWGRQSNAQYQYQLSGDTVSDLSTWGPLLYKTM